MDHADCKLYGLPWLLSWCPASTAAALSATFTLALLPAVVCVVIMMVNGNVGTGVAAAGVFSPVRLCSTPGAARKISAIFVAMGIGPITGMGCLAYDAAMKDAAPEKKFIDRCGCATAT